MSISNSCIALLDFVDFYHRFFKHAHEIFITVLRTRYTCVNIRVYFEYVLSMMIAESFRKSTSLLRDRYGSLVCVNEAGRSCGINERIIQLGEHPLSQASISTTGRCSPAPQRHVQNNRRGVRAWGECYFSLTDAPLGISPVKMSFAYNLLIIGILVSTLSPKPLTRIIDLCSLSPLYI